MKKVFYTILFYIAFAIELVIRVALMAPVWFFTDINIISFTDQYYSQRIKNLIK